MFKIYFSVETIISLRVKKDLIFSSKVADISLSAI